MEHIYRVRTPFSEALLRETYWPAHYFSKERKLRYAFRILIALGLNVVMVLLAIDMIEFWRYYSLGVRIFYLLMVAFYLVMDCRTIFEAQFYVRKEVKQHRKEVGDRVTCTDVLFYDNYFCFHSGVSSATYTAAYSDIVEVRETEHFCMLRTNAMIFFFSKAGFVDGTYEQAIRFVKEKANIS